MTGAIKPETPSIRPRMYTKQSYVVYLTLKDNACYVDCKTAGFFFSKSVKGSVNRSVRVLRARSARASRSRKACEAREKNPTVYVRKTDSPYF